MIYADNLHSLFNYTFENDEDSPAWNANFSSSETGNEY